MCSLAFFLWNLNIQISFLGGDNYFRVKYSMLFFFLSHVWLHFHLYLIFDFVFPTTRCLEVLLQHVELAFVFTPWNSLYSSSRLLLHCSFPHPDRTCLLILFLIYFFAGPAVSIQEKIKLQSPSVLASCRFDLSLWLNLDSSRYTSFTFSPITNRLFHLPAKEKFSA